MSEQAPGIIFTAKFAAEKEKAEGEAKANAPFFKKGLGHGRPVPAQGRMPGKAPGLDPGLDFSLFDFAKIGLSIAGGGPWLSFALDAVDTMSQVVSGDMSLGDGLLNVAKGAAGVGIGAAASWAGSVAGDTVKSIGLGAVGSVAGSVSSAVVQNYVNCYANSAIQALDFNHGFKFDKDKFKEGTKNIHSSALSAALTATASSTVMAAFGADWNNGKMGFTDATGRDLSFMGAYGKTAQNLAGMASGLSGQLVSAAMGNGFSMNVLSSDDLGLGGNRTGLLSLTLGGDNSGFKLGSSAGWDVSMSAIGNFVGSMDYLTTEMKTDKAAQFFLANNDSKEGMARLTYVNYGNLSGNKDAVKIANDILNGDKSLMFDLEGAGNVGRADTGNNTIRMNADAVNIGADNLGKVGGYTSVMAREGFLLDRNEALGVSGWSDARMVSSGVGKQLTLEAFRMQSGVLNDLSKMGIQFSDEWGSFKNTVDDVAKTGNLGFFKETGRDMGRDADKNFLIDMRVNNGKSVFGDAQTLLRDIASGTGSGTVIFRDNSQITGGGQFISHGDMNGNEIVERYGIEFLDANGKKIIDYKNVETSGKTDFERLLEGAAKKGFVLGANESAGVTQFLSGAVKAYYSQFEGGSSGSANIYGGDTFTYQNTLQVRITDNVQLAEGYYNYHLGKYKDNWQGITSLDDLKKRIEDKNDNEGWSRDGKEKEAVENYRLWLANAPLNCVAGSLVNDVKSLGVIRPDRTLLDVYQAYGKDSLTSLDGSRLISQAQQEDWAKLTGVASKTYQLVTLTGNEAKSFMEAKGMSVMYGKPNNAHFLNLAYRNGGIKTYDPLGRSRPYQDQDGGSFFKNMSLELITAYRNRGYMR